MVYWRLVELSVCQNATAWKRGRFFLFVFFHEVAKTCYLVLSIRIAENAVTMIMTTVLLSFKGFFSRLSRKFLGGLAASFYRWLVAQTSFFFLNLSAVCTKWRSQTFPPIFRLFAIMLTAIGENCDATS